MPGRLVERDGEVRPAPSRVPTTPLLRTSQGTFNSLCRRAWLLAASLLFLATGSAFAQTGSLSGAADAAATAVDLTAQGTTDWAHWGTGGVPGLVRKAGGGSLISTYTVIGPVAPITYPDDLRPISWTGGTPTASATNDINGLYIDGQTNGFQVTVPADTTQRTVKVYVGGWNSSGTFTASLSDGSAASYTNTTALATVQYVRTYTVTYQAASAGQQLTLRWVNATGGGNVTLNAVALATSGAPANVAPTLATVANQTGNVGTAASLTLSGADANGDELTYSATGLPAGLSIAAATGVISGTPTTAATYNVTATVNDGRSGTASRSFTWTIAAAANVAPTLATVANQSGNVGTAASLTLSGADANGDTLTYSATDLPAGLSIAAAIGVISGTPTTAATYNVTATVNDGRGGTASRSFTWTIAAAANVAPTLATVANQTGNVGTAASLTLSGADANGDTLTYSATGLPAGLSIAAATGVISGTPTTAATYNVTATVNDGRSGTASRSFTWTIAAAANVAPTLATVANQSGNVGTAASLTLSGADANGDTLTYSATGLPAGLSIAAATGVISGTPTTAATYNVTATVNDGRSGTASRSFTWTIAAAAAGSLSGAADAAATAVDLTAQGTTDWAHWGTGGVPGLVRRASGGSLISAYTVLGGVAPITYNNDPRPMSWSAGSPTASATNDTNGLYISGQTNGFQVTVPADTTERTVKVYVGGWNSSGTFTASLSDGSATAYSNTTAAVTTQYDRTYTVTYRAASAGQQLTVRWVNANAGGNVTLNAVALATSGAPANTAPTLATVANQSGNVGTAASLTLSGADANGDTLTYSATGLPAGLSIAAATGVISGTPTTAGTYNVTATVNDGRSGTASRSFTWTIAAANVAPTLATVANQTGNVGTAASLTLSGADANGDTLTYSATGLPAGLSIAASTGVISGTPTSAATYSVTATVNDGRSGTASRTFTWTIAAAANVAPTLATVANQTGNVGTAASLTLVGADTDGDALTYSATGLPAGLSIAASTGVISGTPTTVATYNVTATVNDGRSGTASRSFTWTIAAAANVAPTLATVANQSGNVGTAASLTLSGADANGDTLTYSATGLPAGLSIAAATGVISGTPTAAATYNVTATVNDGRSGTASRSFTWTIAAPATLPPVPVSPVPVVNYQYDAQGNLTRVIQAPDDGNFGFATSSTYDALNRPVSTTNAKSGVTSFAYNGREDLTQVTDPRSLVTQTPRNGLGDATQLISPDTGTATHTYDAAGNLKTRTDSRGALATYSYDALNRLTQAVYTRSGQPTLTYVWAYDQTGAGYSNGIGRLTSTTHPSGSTQYTYDPQGRVLTDIQRISAATGANAAQVSKTVGYGYDAAGHVTSVLYPSGRQLSIGYTQGKPSAMSLAPTAGGTAVALISQIQWEPFGGAKSWLWQMTSGTQAYSRVHDTSGRLVRYRLGTVIRDLSYDAGDRITGYTHYDATSAAAQTSLNQTFAYDELARLTGITTATSSWSIGYDANGNRTGVTLNGTTSSYTTSTTSNRLNSLTNPARTLGYDAAGNTTSDTGAAYTSTYDTSGRLATLTKASATTTYSYDALGRRVRKFTSTGTASTVVFVYDQSGQLLGEYDASGATLREYVWLNNTPIAMFTPDPANASNPPLVYYFHTDHLNTPRVVVDKGNNIRWRWLAEPFGTTAPETNPQSLGALTQPLRFPGQYADSESGLSYNYFRDYDASTGRYVQSDPIGLEGGINTYAYANASPLIIADPLGLMGNGANGRSPGPVSGNTPAGLNVTIGAGANVHTPFGIGVGIDGGAVFDTNKNVCFYSNVCYTVGPGISGSFGLVGSIGSGPASTGTTEYSGACYTGGTGLMGSGGVLFGNDGSAQIGRALAGVGGGASSTFQSCRLQYVCLKN